MKAYFNASLLGKEKYIKEFKLIINSVKSLGHKVFVDHVMKRNYVTVNGQTKGQHGVDFQKAIEEIYKSDVMIIETTYPSIGVGHIMTIALKMYKPILVLYQNTPHGLIIGDPNRLLTIKEYNIKKPEKLKHIIELFLKKSEQKLLKKRFNLVIDKAQDEYLEWVAKTQATSRSNFIRQLIDESMRKNKDRLKIKKSYE